MQGCLLPSQLATRTPATAGQLVPLVLQLQSSPQPRWVGHVRCGSAGPEAKAGLPEPGLFLLKAQHSVAYPGNRPKRATSLLGTEVYEEVSRNLLAIIVGGNTSQGVAKASLNSWAQISFQKGHCLSDTFPHTPPSRDVGSATPSTPPRSFLLILFFQGAGRSCPPACNPEPWQAHCSAQGAVHRLSAGPASTQRPPAPWGAKAGRTFRFPGVRQQVRA